MDTPSEAEVVSEAAFAMVASLLATLVRVECAVEGVLDVLLMFKFMYFLLGTAKYVQPEYFYFSQNA